ncbi:MAG: bifunctional metallophosphatase/5'-nucleotidase [Chloroflexi bacterium]|nr:bifunctional metallophosphatase/5'-nucleotidase [Chloroflexota bacterium]
MLTSGKVLIEGMNLIGYHAMVIGDLDLQLGPDILRQRIAEAGFPVLSANLLLTSEGKLLAQPYVVLEVGSRKVGIIGLTWDGASASGLFTLLKADEVLPKYVAELSAQTNIIILLSNMGLEEDQRLSSLVPGIDLIVGGRYRLPMTEGWRNPETGTIVVQAGSQGEWIGRRQLSLDGGGVVLQSLDELVLLTDDFPDDPEMRTFLDNYHP